MWFIHSRKLYIQANRKGYGINPEGRRHEIVNKMTNPDDKKDMMEKEKKPYESVLKITLKSLKQIIRNGKLVTVKEYNKVYTV